MFLKPNLSIQSFMKFITYSKHAEERRGERGYKPEEIEEVILHPAHKKKRYDEKIEVTKIFKNKKILVVYEEKENYIRVVTII